MKPAILISIVLAGVLASQAQQTTSMTSVAPLQPAPNNNVQAPANQSASGAAPGTAAIPPNQINNLSPTDTTARGVATNQLPPTNSLQALQSTNTMAETNDNNPSTVATLSLTNRLATMNPAQAKAVIQIQTGLNALQQIAVNIGGVQNVQQVIMQNPQSQQQVQQVSAQIITLARGRVRPSLDSADRLSFDLVRACSRARLNRDHQLVLAIIINEACNCQNVTAAQFDEVVNQGLIVLRTDGVPVPLCNSLGCDLHGIASEVQPDLGI